MTPEEALRSIARHAGARIDRLAPGAFRLSALPAAAPPRLATPKRTPRPMPAPRSEAGADIVVTASKRDVTRNRFAGNVVRIEGGDLELGGAGAPIG
jgi:hypothetical protein